MLGNILKTIENILPVRALFNLIKNDGLEYAGYLAFLSLFTIFPLFIVIVASIGVFYETKLGLEIITKSIDLIPKYAEGVFKAPIENILRNPAPNVFSLIVVSATWTVTSSLETLRKIFNKIYRIEHPPFFLITRMISVLQFCLAIIIMLAAIATFALLPQVFLFIERNLDINLIDLDVFYLSDVMMFFVFTLIVALIYKILTSTKIAFFSVLPGAVFTVLAWVLSARGLAYYINNFAQFNVIYGSLAGIIMVLLFFYFISAVLLYGAELNFELSQRKNKLF